MVSVVANFGNAFAAGAAAGAAAFAFNPLSARGATAAAATAVVKKRRREASWLIWLGTCGWEIGGHYPLWRPRDKLRSIKSARRVHQ